MRFVMGRQLMKELTESFGLSQNCNRVVIDIPVEGPVKIYEVNLMTKEQGEKLNHALADLQKAGMVGVTPSSNSEDSDNLVAAAPELLELCERILSEHKNPRTQGVTLLNATDFFNKLSKTVDKAKGTLRQAIP